MSTDPACSLSDYRRHVRGLPRPSAEQVENFVQFVSGAHSWYKHLPLFPPGVPFHFFLDPFSGYDHVVLPDGRLTPQERTETSSRFHYTWMTTEEYRRRFGHLQYEAAAGTYFRVQSQGEVREYRNRPVFYTANQAYHIPAEVAEAGTAELTAAVHPSAREGLNTFGIWHMMLDIRAERYAEDHPEEWPAASGGADTLRQIKQVLDRFHAEAAAWHARYEEMTKEEREAWWFVRDAIQVQLATLVLPEARRLQANMTGAINRMLALVYD
jgi:hypothetical protein